MTKTFNPPPHWPEPPHPGWAPPAGWRPDRAWGTVPAGWRVWSAPAAEDEGSAPLAESEDIPASGVPVVRSEGDYPVVVSMPGAITRREISADLRGFPPAPPHRPRPRLRLTLRILAALLGLLLAAATALLFLRLVHFAQEELPAQSMALVSVTSATDRPDGAMHPASPGASGGRTR